MTPDVIRNEPKPPSAFYSNPTRKTQQWLLNKNIFFFPSNQLGEEGGLEVDADGEVGSGEVAASSPASARVVVTTTILTVLHLRSKGKPSTHSKMPFGPSRNCTNAGRSLYKHSNPTQA